MATEQSITQVVMQSAFEATKSVREVDNPINNARPMTQCLHQTASPKTTHVSLESS